MRTLNEQSTRYKYALNEWSACYKYAPNGESTRISFY